MKEKDFVSFFNGVNKIRVIQRFEHTMTNHNLRTERKKKRKKFFYSN